MIVVAGPPGGGKSTLLGRDHFKVLQIPYFNIDEKCKEIHGSAQNIPINVRNRANSELRLFCRECFLKRVTFGFETTLRAPFAIEQTGLARAAAFDTELHFIAAPISVHLERVRARAQAGGHAASDRTLRTMYEESMTNLSGALRAFDHCLLYDSDGQIPKLLVETQGKRITRYKGSIPDWMKAALLSK